MRKLKRFLAAIGGLVLVAACSDGGGKGGGKDPGVVEFASGYDITFSGYYEDADGRETFGETAGHCDVQQIGAAVLYCGYFLALAGPDAASFDDKFSKSLYGIPIDMKVVGAVDTSGGSITVNGAWHISDPPYEYEVHYDIVHN